MRHLIVPVLLLVLLFYLVDFYFAHGVYFRMVRDTIYGWFS